MDLLSMLKLSNIFSPNGQMNQQNFPIGSIGGGTSPMPDQSDQGQMPQQPIIPGMDDNSNLMQMLNPKEDQYDRLSQLIQQIPQKSQYEPSLGRRISAFAANLGSGGPVGIAGGQPIGYKSNIPEGLKVQSAIEDDPYNKAIQNWLTQEQPTLEAAKLENARNINSRIAGSNVRTQQLRNEEENRKRNWDLVRQQDLEAKQENAAERTQISRQRQAAYTYDKEHPNHKYQEDSEGNVYSVDPKTDETQYLFDPDGNKIKSKNLSDEMKLKLQNQNALQQIGARGSEARKTELTRQSGQQTLEEEKQGNRNELVNTKANTKTATGTAKAETPQQKTVRLYNTFREQMNKHPEWRPYVEQDDPIRKVFKISTPEGRSGIFGFGSKQAGDPKVAQQILDSIYGAEKPTAATSKGIVRADGKTHVKKKDTGETGWVTNPDTSKYELIP